MRTVGSRRRGRIGPTSWLLAAALAIALLAFPPDAGQAAGAALGHANVVEVLIGGEEHRLEVAATRAQRVRGLMWRGEVSRGTGMLFVRQTPWNGRFTMRNCLVPLDLILMDEQCVVVSVYEMKVEPLQQVDETMQDYLGRLPTYRAPKPIRHAIELLGGEAVRLNVRVGTRISLPKGHFPIGDCAETGR